MSMNKWLWGGLGWALGGPIGAINNAYQKIKKERSIP